jgi:hypothetical protein
MRAIMSSTSVQPYSPSRRVGRSFLLRNRMVLRNGASDVTFGGEVLNINLGSFTPMWCQEPSLARTSRQEATQNPLGKNHLPSRLSQSHCFVTASRGVKDMMMRVGFEPTPFRTSDCMVYQMVTP